MRKTCKRRAGGNIPQLRITAYDIPIHSGSVKFNKITNGWETAANLNKAFSETWKTMHIVFKFKNYTTHLTEINKLFGDIAKYNNDPSVNPYGNAFITITNKNVNIQIGNRKLTIVCDIQCSPVKSYVIDLNEIAEIAIDEKLETNTKVKFETTLLGGKRARRQTRRRSIRK